MKKVFTFLFALLLLPFLAYGQDEMSPELAKLNWQKGPGKGQIGTQASIQIPAGYLFLDDKETSKYLQLAGNPPAENHFLIAPKSLNWFVVFDFDETGYVKDDEKIDPDKLLKDLQASDEPGNKERKKLGLEALYTDGWQVAPHYDTATKRLEWGLRLRDEKGEKTVNYTSRLLGRSGVMSAVLVADVESLDKDIQEFKQVLTGYSYLPGQAYTEFRSGDKIAEYGLAALVLGGAAAVATKKGFWGAIVGFFAAFWKIILGAFVALGAGFGKLFGKKK